MKELLDKVEQQSENCSSGKRYDDFDHGVYQKREDVHVPVVKGLGDSERDREHHESHHIVESDDRQEHARQRTIRLVLLDDHEGGSRSCRCGNGSQSYGT